MDPSPNPGAPPDLLAALYGSVTRDDALPVMLDLLAARFRCRSAAFFYADRLLPRADVVRGHGLFDEPAQARYRDRFAHLDPLPGLMTRLPVGRAAASDRLFRPDEILALPFIREFYHPLGLREALGGPIVNEEGRLGIVSVHRGPDREPFGDDEIRDFEALIPHLTQAVQLRRRFFALADEARTAADALDATALAVLVLAPSGALGRANAAARALLARGDGLALSRAGRLEARDPPTARRLRDLLAAGLPAGRPAVLPVPRGGDGHQAAYTLRLAPAPAGGFIAHVSDPDRPSADPTPLLMAALDLSLPAARLVAALLRGDDLKDHARATGLSPNTVKYHLKAAFTATGTRRQADLVRLATGIARDFETNY
ncbi:helix-turn-helix transcriptional regulator [Methylobacterium sp. Gmos1]